MKKPNLSRFFKNTQVFMTKHSPEILTGVGIAGMFTTVVLAVQATPKAMRNIEELRDELEQAPTKTEIVKACWKCYIPAAITGVTSTACFIGATSVSVRRTAALAAAYQLSETALSEYRDKVIETVGEKKEQVVREKVAEEKLKQNPPQETDIIKTKKGTTRCFDPLSARYFESDIEFIRRAENNLNKRLNYDMGSYVTVNDFYDELELPHTDLGEHMGWNSDNQLDLDITAILCDDGEPAVYIGHYTPPKYEYCY